MELRHIRYFLAIAEERNFTRAAARLGIGQPPLSLQMRDLEREIGARLFHRLSHGVELTDAGVAFLKQVSGIPDVVAKAARHAQRAAAGETGHLNLGIATTAALHPLLPKCIKEFRLSYPDVELEIHEANSIVLREMLTEERVDLAIIRPSPSPIDGVIEELFCEDRLVVAVPSDHWAVAHSAGIELVALKHEPFIFTPRNIGPHLHNACLDACHMAGFEPIRGQSATQIATILTLVSAGLGVSLVPASFCELSNRGVHLIPLRDIDQRVAFSICWRKSSVSASAMRFFQLVRRLTAPVLV